MGGRLLFAASWILLASLVFGVAFFSVASTMSALRRAPDQLAPTYSVEQLAGVSEEAADAVRGRRVTAATWALAYALLLGCVVLVPYRRGEQWAWWAVLVSLGLSQILSASRVLALGLHPGAGTSGIVLAFALIGLLAGAPRMFNRARPMPGRP